jgi:hypothetical protein
MSSDGIRKPFTGECGYSAYFDSAVAALTSSADFMRLRELSAAVAHTIKENARTMRKCDTNGYGMRTTAMVFRRLQDQSAITNRSRQHCSVRERSAKMTSAKPQPSTRSMGM